MNREKLLGYDNVAVADFELLQTAYNVSCNHPMVKQHFHPAGGTSSQQLVKQLPSTDSADQHSPADHSTMTNNVAPPKFNYVTRTPKFNIYCYNVGTRGCGTTRLTL